ncbi:hypothetical protein [Aliiroseovarius sediminis]|uniref:hypothetical protein n=1 Tax=Aliiroseovarius sediminis TaxID=2925839 RepID=UPI001F572E58|nr:hypothetical protein [uncultured Aliiroseovarius sp.]MCI2393375.1 hypothetical protein [Aliiroseovarius sediminis]
MSETDTFIDEVSEEVRRDKLYALMRKYGWIAIALVLLLVGGAAFNEWRKASERTQAQALGDAILAAEEQTDPKSRTAALAEINAQGDAAAVVAMLSATEGADAAEALRGLADNPDLDPLYRDLAQLKLVSMPGASLDLTERRARLESLAVAGAPFRTLAEEQLALVEVEEGQTDAAIARLKALLQDDGASGPLRRRASQLIVALGGVAETS